jgi:hypothetical protein
VTPEAAIYQFMNGFGMPAYPHTSVPDQDGPLWEGFPYLTYNLVVGEWMEGEVNMPVNLWDRTESEARLNAKVREISRALGIGGVTCPCDGGMVWLKKGSPWAQAMTVEGEDDMVKRRYININIEYLTIE